MHNLCIANNARIEEEWIIEAKNELARRINKREIREDNELQGEKAGLSKVRRKILARENIPIANKVNGVETKFFLLRKNKKANNLL